MLIDWLRLFLFVLLLWVILVLLQRIEKSTSLYITDANSMKQGVFMTRIRRVKTVGLLHCEYSFHFQELLIVPLLLYLAEGGGVTNHGTVDELTLLGLPYLV